MNNETQIHGVAVMGVVWSADRVSPLFGRKIRHLLADRGITTLEQTETYPAEAVVGSISEIAREFGSKPVASAGAVMAREASTQSECETSYAALQRLAELPEDWFDDPAEQYPIGRYTLEKEGSREARLGVTDAFPYPPDITKGSIRGALVSTGASPLRIERTRPRQSEQFAYYIKWNDDPE
ncbi:hypothetical protein SAMN05216226_102185 [Halovenus aranensis]|uniref:Uncharacterized protein n=1 Tax=Halovenus aranensis TaxID=890420 RepID=A0A1G8SWM4_9EURY|nr:hypothetical protein [Halovenus aranensis]SDJ33658.1 hypothetical protein SAMN05216226_102185 [Halovenus aranensis]